LLALRRGRERVGELADEAVPLVDRGREAAESLARDAAEHVPSRARRRRRCRGAFALLLLALAGGVALYVAWQRRDREPARLSFEPDGPDVAPPPPPEPPPASVEDAQREALVAVSSELSAEQVDGEAEVAPAVNPAPTPTELELPPEVAPAVEAVLTAVEDLAEAVPGDEAGEPVAEPDEAAEADQAAAYPAAEVTEETAEVEGAAEESVVTSEDVGASEPEEDLIAPTAEPEMRRFAPAVSETVQPEPPEPASDRPLPLRSPLRGANPLPPSNPAGAPFRSAGDGLPGGRSWPTLPS
jgi:hypothetical protein